MPSVFGIDDNDDLKPWVEGHAFQRSKQPQIQREQMIHILYKSLRWSDDHLTQMSFIDLIFIPYFVHPTALTCQAFFD